MNLEFKELTKNQDAKIQFVLGITLALVAAFVMWHGNLFAENNTGIAIVVGIIGIGLIATSRLRKNKA